MSEELYNSHDYCSLAEQYEQARNEVEKLQKIILNLSEYHGSAEKTIEKLNSDIVTLNNRLTDAVTLNGELVEKVESRDEIIARLKEDGERLASGYEQVSREAVPYCVVCKKDAFSGYLGQIKHDDWCPITLHRALMKELE